MELTSLNVPTTHILSGELLLFCCCTYESDEEEHDLEAPAERGHAGNVAVPDGRHGHHEEVDALPVRQLLAVEEVGWVARVLQLLVEGGQRE